MPDKPRKSRRTWCLAVHRETDHISLFSSGGGWNPALEGNVPAKTSLIKTRDADDPGPFVVKHIFAPDTNTARMLAFLNHVNDLCSGNGGNAPIHSLNALFGRLMRFSVGDSDMFWDAFMRYQEAVIAVALAWEREKHAGS